MYMYMYMYIIYMYNKIIHGFLVYLHLKAEGSSSK